MVLQIINVYRLETFSSIDSLFPFPFGITFYTNTQCVFVMGIFFQYKNSQGCTYTNTYIYEPRAKRETERESTKEASVTMLFILKYLLHLNIFGFNLTGWGWKIEEQWAQVELKDDSVCKFLLGLNTPTKTIELHCIVLHLIVLYLGALAGSEKKSTLKETKAPSISILVCKSLPGLSSQVTLISNRNTCIVLCSVQTTVSCINRDSEKYTYSQCTHSVNVHKPTTKDLKTLWDWEKKSCWTEKVGSWTECKRA